MLWVRGVVCLAVVVLAGCTDDSDSPLSPDETFSQSLSGSVAVFSESRHAVPITVSGDLTLRLTWSDPAVDLDLYLTASTCTQNLYPLGSCGVLLASIASTGTSEVITRPVSSGEQFQVWVDNLSTTAATNYTLEIEIE